MNIPHVRIRTNGDTPISNFYEVQDSETGDLLPVKSFELEVATGQVALATLTTYAVVDELDVAAVAEVVPERATTLRTAADRLLDLCDEHTSGTIQLAQAVREIATEICAATNGAQSPRALRSSDNDAAPGVGNAPGSQSRPGGTISASTVQNVASHPQSPGDDAAAVQIGSPSGGPPDGAA